MKRSELNLERSLLVRELLLRKEAWRRQCRNDYVAWCTEALSPLSMQPALHHKLICEEIQKLVEGPPGGRLMFFAPPGSAKTTYVSRLSVPWILQRHPRWSIIGASHGSMLSQENSGYAIRYANDYADLLGYRLTSENVQRWRTDKGGDYLAASVEGGIAGFRADLAIVDDPIRMRKDADSATFQNSLWRWWTADLERRLKPEGHIILMHTRWNLRDLAGMLLKTDAKRWRVVSLPALATADNDPLGRMVGEPLWADDDYNYGSKLIEIRDELMRAGAAMDWASLFQQDPRPNDGALFKIDKLAANIIDAAPANISWVRGWDLAATKDLGTLNAAFTAGVKLGRTPDNKFVIADVRRERLEPEGVEDLIVGTAKRDGYSTKVGIPQDPGQAGKFQVQYLVTKLAGYSVEFSPETGDKATRAAPFASQVNVGNVAMLKGDWNDAFLEEARAFPVGATLDQIDASSRAFSMIFKGGAALWAAVGKS